jgi:predicted Fe-Mo cluster-binding NifX family protein
MIIAVASQNRRTVTGHAGKTRRFVLWNAEPGKVPAEADRLDLPKEMVMHNIQGNDPHPLDRCDVLIAESAGPGFVNRLAGRGIKVVLTAETDPAKAVTDYLAGTLAPPSPESQQHGEGHGHSHQHGHGHGHGQGRGLGRGLGRGAGQGKPPESTDS